MATYTVSPPREIIIILTLASLILLIYLYATYKGKRIPFLIIGGKYKNIAIPIIFVGFLALSYITLTINITSISITNDKLRISIPSMLIWRDISKAEVEDIYVINYQINNSYSPIIRTFGISLGKYNLGYFILSNGKNAIVLSKSEVNIVIELADGSIIMVYVDNFEEFKEEILAWI